MADRSNEDARLKALLDDGLTYDQCAAQLALEGFPARTRHAHIGRAFRQGFGPARAGMSTPKVVKPRATRAKPARQALRFNGRFGSGVAPTATKRAVVVVKPETPPAPLPFDRPGVPYRTATRAQCAFPLWGDAPISIDARRVCGEPAIPGGSYCPACHGVVYQPLPRIGFERNARKYSMHDGLRVAKQPDETPDLCAEMA